MIENIILDNLDNKQEHFLQSLSYEQTVELIIDYLNQWLLRSTARGQGAVDILRSQGIPASTQPNTPQSIQQALSQGKGVVSSHDVRALWNNGQQGGHAVQTAGLVRDSSGRVTHYIINDTGSNQTGRLVPAAQYDRSLNPDNVAAITDNPIWWEGACI